MNQIVHPQRKTQLHRLYSQRKMTGEEPVTTNGAASESSPPREEALVLTELQKPDAGDAETLNPSYKETVRKEVLEVLNHLNIVRDNG